MSITSQQSIFIKKFGAPYENMETKDGIPFAAYFMAESLRATLHDAAHGAAYDDAYGDEDDATRDAARNHTCASKYLPLPILTVAIRPDGSHMQISEPR